MSGLRDGSTAGVVDEVLRVRAHDWIKNGPEASLESQFLPRIHIYYISVRAPPLSPSPWV